MYSNLNEEALISSEIRQEIARKRNVYVTYMSMLRDRLTKYQNKSEFL